MDAGLLLSIDQLILARKYEFEYGATVLWRGQWTFNTSSRYLVISLIYASSDNYDNDHVCNSAAGPVDGFHLFYHSMRHPTRFVRIRILRHNNLSVLHYPTYGWCFTTSHILTSGNAIFCRCAVITITIIRILVYGLPKTFLNLDPVLNILLTVQHSMYLAWQNIHVYFWFW